MSDDLQLRQAEQVDAICDRFEQDFRDGKQPRIEDFLAETPSLLQTIVRHSLIALEIELRQTQGQHPQLEEYAQRFPTDIEVVTEAFADLQSALSSVKASLADTSRGVTPALASSGRLEPLKELGRFQVLSQLGAGAFGTVYKAHDPQLDRLVAIKVPRAGSLQSSEDRDRFLREARSAAGLHHPQICPVYEVGTIGDRDYIVMALIDGKPLSKVLQSQPRLSDKQIASVIRKVARGLQEAHEKGIVHRDLKPANIMINRKGEPVIMDFGLARRAKATDPEISRSGQILGTPAYMSPEQARGGGKTVGPATDVYSLGVIMYEMLCGRRPFEGTVTEVIGQILHVDITPPSTHRPGVNPQLEAICLKAIAKNPAERYASMKQLAEALEDFLRSLSTLKSQATPTVEETPAFETKQIEKIFAAVSSDLEKRVEHAVERHRAPPKIPWWPTLIGSGFMGVIVLFGIVFFLPTRTVRVSVTLDVNVNDPELGFFLDGKNIDRSQLLGEIELTPGKHELIVLKDNQVYRRYELNAIRGNDTAEVVVKESVSEPIQEMTGPRRVEVSELNLTGYDTLPWLSVDGLTIYWEGENPKGAVEEGPWVYSAQRPDAQSPFAGIKPLFPARHPTLTGDELEMVFIRGRLGAGSLRFAKRNSIKESFVPSGEIPELVGQPNPKSPFLTEDGLMLVFQRGRQEQNSVEFVYCTRPNRTSAWSMPQPLPMSADPTRAKPLTWPFLSRDGLTLWYCHGGDRAPEICKATRPDLNSPFGNHQSVIVEGSPLIGRAPRFVAATGELFYSPNLSLEQMDWSLWVVKDYASPRIEISQDSVIGEWDWGWGEIEHGKEPIYQNEIKFHADGTCIGRIGGIQGKWERTGNQIVIRWANNAQDTVTISKDGRKLDGKNKEGTMPIRGRKKTKSDWTSLFNGKDLTGWKMPPNSPSNPWKVQNGLMTAEPGLPMSMLITERENYRDVHVRAEAKLESGRVGIKVRTPADHDPHAAVSYTLALFDQTPPPEQGRVSAFKPPLNTWVTLEMIVRGFHVTAMVDGKVIEEYDDPQRLRTAGHIGLARGPNTKVSFQNIEVKELQSDVAVSSPADDGWIDLFNGKTLAGWKPIGPAEWTVRQGAAFVAGTKKGHLVCDQTFEDFELTGEVYADARGNGGVCVRVSEVPQGGGLQRGGYEFQVAGSQGDPGKNYTGGLYADSTVVRVNPSRVDDKTWAQIRLRVSGNRLQGWVDDQPTFDVNGDAARMTGRKLSLQCFGQGGEVGYRNFRIRPLAVDRAGQHADRAFAEWVLRHKGNVRIETPHGEILKAKKETSILPNGPFVVRGFFIDSPLPLDKSGFELLKQLTGLESLGIEHNDLTDDDIRRLGLMPIAKRVASVDFHGKDLTDAGLESLAGWSNLEDLNFGQTRATWSGLDKLRGLKLKKLLPASSPFGDAALAHVLHFPDLQHIDLADTKVTDAGMVHLTKLPKLEGLVLFNTALTDAGLTTLHEVSPSLRRLWIRKTKVTAEGIAAFRAARPEVSVDADVEPRMEPDRPAADTSQNDPTRTAADWVLNVKGSLKIRIGGAERNIQRADQLPNGDFDIVEIKIVDQRNSAINDGIGVLAGLSELRTLDLMNSDVTDAGVQKLTGLRGLTFLSLHDCPVTDDCLDSVAAMTQLERLWLHYRPFTDAGMAKLIPLQSLRELAVIRSKITNAGLRSIAQLKSLEILNIAGTLVDDDGLRELQSLTQLRSLPLDGSRITGSGLTHLAHLKNLTYLSLGDGIYGGPGNLTDEGLAAVAELNSLKVLAIGDDRSQRLTDAGVAHLAKLKQLRDLKLNLPRLSNEGLASLGELEQLEQLSLRSPLMSADGVKHLMPLSKLWALGLHGEQITDSCLLHIKELWRLKHLDFSQCRISGSELGLLSALAQLESLSLSQNPVESDSLKHIAGMRKLNALYLRATKVTDRGLAGLHGAQSLRTINLSDSPVTNAGLDDLRRALPDCTIHP